MDEAERNFFEALESVSRAYLEVGRFGKAVRDVLGNSLADGSMSLYGAERIRRCTYEGESYQDDQSGCLTVAWTWSHSLTPHGHSNPTAWIDVTAVLASGGNLLPLDESGQPADFPFLFVTLSNDGGPVETEYVLSYLADLGANFSADRRLLHDDGSGPLYLAFSMPLFQFNSEADVSEHLVKPTQVLLGCESIREARGHQDAVFGSDSPVLYWEHRQGEIRFSRK